MAGGLPLQHCWRRFNTFLLSLLAEKREIDCDGV